MIETLNVRAPLDGYLVGNLFDYALMCYPVGRWKHGRAGGAVCGTPLPGGASLSFQHITLGPNKGQASLVVEGNLTRVRYGADAKSLTLHPDDVQGACVDLLSSLSYVLGNEVPDPSRWRVSRVDANATVELLEIDALSWLDAVGESMKSAWPRTWSRPGILSYRAKPTMQEQLAAYSKSVESEVLGPSGGHLARLEYRTYGRKAREVYGDTLLDVMGSGGNVAQERVSRWMDRFGRAAFSEPSRIIVDRLIARGMDPTEAFRLVGPALVLASDGLEGLTSRGVSQRTAYRWATEIRAVVSDPESFLDLGGIEVTVDDVVYAGESPLKADATTP